MEVYKKVKNIEFGKHIAGERFDLIVCNDKEYGKNLSGAEAKIRIDYVNSHLIPALTERGTLHFGNFRLNHSSTF